MRFHFTISAFVAMALVACGGGGSDAASSATPKAKKEPVPSAKPAPPPAAATPAAVATMSKEELGAKVCFFTPAEIKEVLGFAVEPGKPDTKMLSYNMASCTYWGTENSLRVSAIWIDPTQIGATRASMTRLSGGGRIEAVAGDPDAAYFHDQQDNGVSIHYLRGNIRMQVQATSSRTVYATMKPRLLKLRRVP